MMFFFLLSTSRKEEIEIDPIITHNSSKDRQLTLVGSKIQQIGKTLRTYYLKYLLLQKKKIHI